MSAHSESQAKEGLLLLIFTTDHIFINYSHLENDAQATNICFGDSFDFYHLQCILQIQIENPF